MAASFITFWRDDHWSEIVYPRCENAPIKLPCPGEYPRSSRVTAACPLVTSQKIVACIRDRGVEAWASLEDPNSISTSRTLGFVSMMC